MSCPALSSKAHSRVFETFPECLHSIATLARIQKIDSELLDSSDLRDESLQWIKRVWSSALEEIKHGRSVEEEKQKIQQGLQWYYGFYRNQLENAKTPQDIETVARRALSDINSVPGNPIVRPYRGNKGPTLLVSFVDCDPNLHTQAYVLKWTGPNELWANRIYKLLSLCPSPDDGAPAHGHGFTVPAMGWIDFDSFNYVKTDGQAIHMDSSLASPLKEQLQLIAKKRCNGDPFEKSAKNQVMYSDRIFAGSLFDFAYTLYPDLSTNEKIRLFCRLARLSLLDVLVGNLDRLIPIAKNESNGYQFDHYEANIANVLVSTAKGGCDLFAIDNEIDSALIDSPKAKDDYLDFLRTLFSSHDFHKQLAQTMIESIKIAIVSYMDDDKTARSNKEKFQYFLTDLDEFSSYIEQQFFQMTVHLQEMLSAHENPSDFFPADLIQGYPALADSVWNRLQLFKNLRRHPCPFPV